MTIETDDDLEALKKIGQIVAECLRTMLGAIRPGMTTLELDEIGERFLLSKGARSAPRLDYAFPGSTCISINEQVAHGIPGDRIIQPGDLVNVDVSAELNGYYGDTGGSIGVAPVPELAQKVCVATRAARDRAIDSLRAGDRLSVIGRAIEKQAKASGLRIVRNLCSHGVGRKLHEPPEAILPYYSPREHRTVRYGDVITIEPFLTTGREAVEEASDGWTLLNERGSWTAQYEHTLVITRGRPLIMTA